MIFENTWQGETVLHEAFIDDNADVSIREVTLGGDPIEDFVSYHPNICLLYTSPSPRDMRRSRMPSSA